MIIFLNMRLDKVNVQTVVLADLQLHLDLYECLEANEVLEFRHLFVVDEFWRDVKFLF